ncbi:MAG TPA: CoA transferase [Acidimicrobiales bacterium]|nr:CoA transferase [Acidimicrobiales bacterium]
MRGIRVVEVGVWVAGPSAGAILADWGADVVKIEAPTGDPYRWVYTGAPGEQALNAPFEFDNRGKRCVALRLDTPEGREVVGRLLAGADVFLTNMRPRALEGWGLDYASVAADHPRLIYASVTGYGTEGPDRDRASYDFGGFWSRSGIAAALTQPASPPPAQRGGMGDHVTGATIAGGIAAALFERERTGRGQRVSTSLLRTGLYVLGWDTSHALRTGRPLPIGLSRASARNPLFNCYLTADGHWFWLLGLEGDRHWPAFAVAIDRPEWIEDERYSTLALRAANAAELIAALDTIFVAEPLAVWAERFDNLDVWWAPVRTTAEVLDDPQVAASGALVEAEMADGRATVLATPVDFSVTPAGPGGPSPEVGQHTEAVLLELGYDWDEIISLKEASVIL